MSHDLALALLRDAEQVLRAKFTTELPSLTTVRVVRGGVSRTLFLAAANREGTVVAAEDGAPEHTGLYHCVRVSDRKPLPVGEIRAGDEVALVCPFTADNEKRFPVVAVEMVRDLTRVRDLLSRSVQCFREERDWLLQQSSENEPRTQVARGNAC